MRVLVASCLAAVMLAAAGCTPQQKPVDLTAAATEARAVVDQFHVVMQTEDLDLLSRTMAHDDDMVCFGTDASERWVGWDMLKASVGKQFESFENTQITVRDQTIKVGPSGDVAWFTEVMDWNTTTGGQTVELKGLRFTGVAEKREGGWVIVQFTTSMPVQGQAAQY